VYLCSKTKPLAARLRACVVCQPRNLREPARWVKRKTRRFRRAFRFQGIYFTRTGHLYRRGEDGLWQDAVLKGLDAVVELEKLKISVPSCS
jgi:hypothetical protein